MTAINWASSDAGARLIDFSSEIEGCEAENVLNPKLNSIWLTEEGLPQWFCLSLSGIQNVRDVVIRTVGWHCWHPYSTNPKVVTLHVSPDGSKFKRWDSFRATAPQKGTQLFCCAPISSAVYPFLAFEVTEVFGGNQTYMNRLFLYSDEIASSPQVSETGNNKLDNVSLNTGSSSQNSINSDSMEMNSLLQQLEHSLGLDASGDTYLSDHASSTVLTAGGSTGGSFRQSHAELRKRIEDKRKIVATSTAAVSTNRQGEGEGGVTHGRTLPPERHHQALSSSSSRELPSDDIRGEVSGGVSRDSMVSQTYEEGKEEGGEEENFIMAESGQGPTAAAESEGIPASAAHSPPLRMQPHEMAVFANSKSASSSKTTTTPVVATSPAEPPPDAMSARIRGVIHDMAAAEDEQRVREREEQVFTTHTGGSEANKVPLRHSIIENHDNQGDDEGGEAGSSSDSLPLQMSVGIHSPGRGRRRGPATGREQADMTNGTRHEERRHKRRSPLSKSPDGILRRIKQAASRVGVDVSFSHMSHGERHDDGDDEQSCSGASSRRSGERLRTPVVLSEATGTSGQTVDTTVVERIGALEAKMSDLISALNTFKGSSAPRSEPPTTTVPRRLERDDDDGLDRRGRVQQTHNAISQDDTWRSTGRRTEDDGLYSRHGREFSDRSKSPKQACCAHCRRCVENIPKQCASQPLPRIHFSRGRYDGDNSCCCVADSGAMVCGSPQGTQPDLCHTVVLSLERSLRSLLDSEVSTSNSGPQGRHHPQRRGDDSQGQGADMMTTSRSGSSCPTCMPDRYPQRSDALLYDCTTAPAQRSFRAERDSLGSGGGGKGPGGVFRPFVLDTNGKDSSDGLSGYNPERNRKCLLKPSPSVGTSVQLRKPVTISPPVVTPQESSRHNIRMSESFPADYDKGESLEEIVESLHKKILMRTVKEAELKMIRRIKDA